MNAISIKKTIGLFAIMAILSGFTFSLNAQTADKMDGQKGKVKTEQMRTMKAKKGKSATVKSMKMPMKKHVCTKACHDSGTHAYVHGEKGHMCTSDCKKPIPSDKNMKEHICTEACHNSGTHVYAHGEKGHMCATDCKKNMKK